MQALVIRLLWRLTYVYAGLRPVAAACQLQIYSNFRFAPVVTYFNVINVRHFKGTISEKKSANIALEVLREIHTCVNVRIDIRNLHTRVKLTDSCP